MIRIVDIASKPKSPTPEGCATAVLSPSEDGTRVEVTIRELAPWKRWIVAPAARTQVAYILEGDGATIRHRMPTGTTEQPASRRSGVYLEPGEEALIAASTAPLTVLHVTVPKHTERPTEVESPAGYVFVESRLQSLIDEKRFRERTFWVNKETGLSGSWDLQIGRMQYAPHAHSPRHVHHPSKTSPVVPEHFYLIEKGTGEVRHDGGTLAIEPGCLVLIPAGEWHQLVASETGFDYIEFQAPFDFVTTMDHDPLGKNWYIKGTDDGTGKPRLWVQS